MKIKINGLPMRTKCTHIDILNGVFKPKYCIEINIKNRVWLKYANENGVVLFDSKQEAETEIKKLKEAEEAK